MDDCVLVCTCEYMQVSTLCWDRTNEFLAEEHVRYHDDDEQEHQHAPRRAPPISKSTTTSRSMSSRERGHIARPSSRCQLSGNSRIIDFIRGGRLGRRPCHRRQLRRLRRRALPPPAVLLVSDDHKVRICLVLNGACMFINSVPCMGHGHAVAATWIAFGEAMLSPGTRCSRSES